MSLSRIQGALQALPQGSTTAGAHLNAVVFELKEGKALLSTEPVALNEGGTMILKQGSSGKPATPAGLDTAGCSAAACMLPGCKASPLRLNAPCSLMLAQCLAKSQHCPMLLYTGCRLDCCSVPEDFVHPPGSLHNPFSKCQMAQSPCLVPIASVYTSSAACLIKKCLLCCCTFSSRSSSSFL